MRLFIIILSVILFTACNSKSISNDALKWNIDLSDIQSNNLSEIIDSIYLIPLETSDECLVKKSYALKYGHDVFYINNDQSEILAFDHSGTFLFSTAQSFGIGPNDYRSIQDFRVLGKDSIEIFDSMLQKTYSYTPTNGLHQTFQYPREILPTTEYEVINDSVALFSDGVSLKVWQKECPELKEFKLSDYAVRFIKTSWVLFPYNERVYCSAKYPSNTLYVVSEDFGINPIYELDFGKHTFDMDEEINHIKKQGSQFVSLHSDYAYPYGKYELKDAYLAFFRYENNFCFAYKRMSDNSTVVMRNVAESIGQLVEPDLIIEDKLYYLCEPAYLSYFIDKSLMNENDINLMNIIDEFDNPVIIVYKLKNII